VCDRVLVIGEGRLESFATTLYAATKFYRQRAISRPKMDAEW